MNEVLQIVNELDHSELAVLFRKAEIGNLEGVAATVAQYSNDINLCIGGCKNCSAKTCWMKRHKTNWSDILQTIDQAFTTRCTNHILVQQELSKHSLNIMARTIIDSMPGSVAILDLNAVIITVNREWIRFALENNYDISADTFLCGIGANYLTVCGDSDDEYAVKARALIQDVIAGNFWAGSMIYPCHSPDEKRWFEVHLQTLTEQNERFILMQHVNVSSAIAASELDSPMQNKEHEYIRGI